MKEAFHRPHDLQSAGVLRASPEADRLCNILKLLLAEVYKRKLHLAADVFVDPAGDTNSAGLCKAFEMGSELDAVAINAGCVRDDITLIEADAEAHAASLFHVGITPRHRSLDCDRALGCVHDATKLCEDPIAAVSMTRPPCSLIMGSTTA